MEEYGKLMAMDTLQQVPRSPQGEAMPRESADVIYVFCDKNKPGIRFFYSKASDALPDHVFVAEVAGIATDVEWGDSVNAPNQFTRVLPYGGTPYTAMTFMLSEKRFSEILSLIEAARKNKSDTMILDLTDREKAFFENMASSLVQSAIMGKDISGKPVDPTLNPRPTRIPGDLYNVQKPNNDNDIGEL